MVNCGEQAGFNRGLRAQPGGQRLVVVGSEDSASVGQDLSCAGLEPRSAAIVLYEPQ